MQHQAAMRQARSNHATTATMPAPWRRPAGARSPDITAHAVATAGSVARFDVARAGGTGPAKVLYDRPDHLLVPRSGLQHSILRSLVDGRVFEEGVHWRRTSPSRLMLRSP